jgi:lysophospholipase L1-like esterase
LSASNNLELVQSSKKTSWAIKLAAYVISIIFVALGILGLLFILAAASEIMMPFVARDRLPIVERGYYVHSDQLGWRLKPNLNIRLINKESKDAKAASGDIAYLSTDAQGFRSTPAFDAKRPLGVVLGDSMAQGFYLTDEQTVPWQLSKLTNSNVLNTGVGGYSSDQELIMLQEVIQQKPQWVVLLFFANDLPWNLERESWGLHKPRFAIDEQGNVNFAKLELPAKRNNQGDTASDTSTADASPDFSPIPSTDPWVRSSDTKGQTICCAYDGAKQWKLIKAKWKKYWELTPKPKELVSQIREDFKWAFPYPGQYSYIMPNRFYQEPSAYPREWNAAFDMMARMKTLSQENGAQFTVAYVPEIGQLLNRDGISDAQLPQAYFMEQCKRRAIHCIDPTPDFAQQKMQVFVQDDGHLSPAGASLMSKLIAQRIGALPASPASPANKVVP